MVVTAKSIYLKIKIMHNYVYKITLIHIRILFMIHNLKRKQSSKSFRGKRWTNDKYRLIHLLDDWLEGVGLVQQINMYRTIYFFQALFS